MRVKYDRRRERGEHVRECVREKKRERNMGVVTESLMREAVPGDATF